MLAEVKNEIKVLIWIRPREKGVRPQIWGDFRRSFLFEYFGQIVGIWTQLAFLMHFEVGILTRFSCAWLWVKTRKPPMFLGAENHREDQEEEADGQTSQGWSTALEARAVHQHAKWLSRCLVASSTRLSLLVQYVYVCLKKHLHINTQTHTSVCMYIICICSTALKINMSPRNWTI